MNIATRIPAGDFEIVNRAHYVLTEDDFPDGYVVERDGRVTGICPRGDRVTTTLNAPLCQGCDRLIENAVCPDCELLFADLLPELDPKEAGKWQ